MPRCRRQLDRLRKDLHLLQARRRVFAGGQKELDNLIAQAWRRIAELESRTPAR
jgi:hypothetical protein